VITERHKYNSLFKEQDIDRNLNKLNHDLQPENLIS